MWNLKAFDGVSSQWECSGCGREVSADNKRPTTPCECGSQPTPEDGVVEYYATIDGKLTLVATIRQESDGFYVDCHGTDGVPNESN